MDHSGLPDGPFAMLIPGALDGSVGLIRQITASHTIGRHDPHRLSSGWFPCVRILPFRPVSMDAGHEAQDDYSYRRGRRSRWDQREERSTDRCFSGKFRKTWPFFGKVTLGPEQEQSVRRLRTWMQRVRTDCLRESRQVV